MTDSATKEAAVTTAPASLGQQQLWLNDRLYGHSGSYNVPLGVRLEGPLDAGAMARSLNEIVARHEVLRTTLVPEGEDLLQVISPEGAIALSVVQVDQPDRAAALEWVRDRVRADGAMPFDLARGPLLRAALYRLAPDDHVLTVVLHHAVFDGWSVGVLLHELGAIYTAFAAGRPSPLPELEIQFADFAAWQREELESAAVGRALEYWTDELAGAPPRIELPTDRQRHHPNERKGALIVRHASPALRTALTELARREGVTLFITLMSAFAALLHRYSGQDDLLIGTPLAGRERQELEPLLGFFVNTVMIRSRLRDDPTVRELLGHVKSTVLNAHCHQDAPFEKVAEILRHTPGAGEWSPLQVMMALQSATPDPGSLGGLKASLFWVHNGTAKFDLFLNAIDDRAGLRFELEYDTALFDVPTIERLLRHYGQLLTAIVSEPAARVGLLPLLSDDELRQLSEWNDTAAERDAADTVVSRFEAQAAASPNEVAVDDGTVSLTYRELNEQANRLARYLDQRGVNAGDRVGICLERSTAMMVAVLAVAKAGAAYVPMDPAYPLERLRFMAADARLRVVLADTPVGRDLLPDQSRVLNPKAHAAEIGACAHQNLGRPVTPAMACYVMYTSGSTGMPKGVVMPHGPLWNLVAWQLSRSRPGLRTIHFGSLSFDVSFQEIFATWLSGGRLVVATETVRRDPSLLLEMLRRERIERIFLPFVALQSLAETAVSRQAALGSLTEVITAGEQLHITPGLRAFFDSLPGCTLDNQYGPTEAHVVTAHRLAGPSSTWPEVPPIGRPVANARIHILDGRLQPTPIGVAGDLWIGGRCLAEGYWNRDDLTEERFVTVAVGGRRERLYRSGDRARHAPGGEIEFLGRGDDQVKVRGFRVEPGEVESALEGHPSIRQAAVVARSHAGVTRLLAFYVVADADTTTVTAIKDFLRERLPDYMIPSAFIAMPALPLTPSGKVDRRSLSDAPETSDARHEAVVPPGDEVEKQLMAIWREMLNLPSLSIHDNFFEVGGHSLVAVRVFNRIETVFGKSLPLSVLFDAPTIAQLATVIRGSEKREARSAIVVINKAPGPPFVCVHSIGGDALEFRELARCLGPEVGFWALHARLDDDIERTYGTVEATAAAYLADLRVLQPVGPYFLGGWSSGGIVAFEIAQQLRAAGEEVALLASIDSAPGPVIRRWSARNFVRLMVNVPRWVRDDLMISRPGDVLWRLRQKIVVSVRRGRAFLLRTAEDYSPNVHNVLKFPVRAKKWETFVETHYHAVMRYVPRPYDGRATVFKARTHPLLWLHDSDLMWQRYARDVEVHVVPGTHLTIARAPNARVLAEELRSAIVRARRNGREATDVGVAGDGADLTGR